MASQFSRVSLLSRVPWRLVLAAGLTWLVWPRHPNLRVDEIRLRSIKVHRLREDDENSIGAAADDDSGPITSRGNNLIRVGETCLRLDLNASLRVAMHNPNVVTVNLHEAKAEVFYRGLVLGTGVVRAVTHPWKSTIKMDIPAVLQGARVLDRGRALLQDVANRRVEIVNIVHVPGTTRTPRFQVPLTIHVRITLVLDPVGMRIISQECIAKLELLGIPPL